MCVALSIGPGVLEVMFLMERYGNVIWFAPSPVNSHATPKGKVRFKEYHLIKPHASVLVSRPANCIPFLSCDSTMEAATLSLFLIYLK